jgi:MFS family permease
MAITTTITTEEIPLGDITAEVRPVQPTSGRAIVPLEVEAVLPNEPEYPTGTKLWLQILSLVMVLILGGLDANIVATAVPSITDHFNTVADVGWYSSAFRLCACAFQFMFAKMYKLFPSRTVLLISNTIFLVGSLLCATATSSRMFVAGRAITGVAFAGMLAGVFAVLNEVLPRQKRPVFTGSLASVESAAIISAPILGGALTQSLGWRWCFW